MLSFPTQSAFPPVPRPPRRKRSKRNEPAPPAIVTVVSATVTGFFEVDFQFSHPVTSIGGAGNEQIVITTQSGAETPSMSEQISATTVRFRIDSGLVEAGDPWEVLVVPEGLDFHGRTFVVPQGGTLG